jgi:tRNA pseudouridine13 synthase
MTIRRTPTDFMVEEILTSECRQRLAPLPAPGRMHAVYELSKVSLATPEAIGLLAREIGLKAGMFDYCGLKDKHAATVQHVSLPVPSPPMAVSLPRDITGRAWSARLVGWSDRALAGPDIERNRFNIVVRDLSAAASDEIDRRAAMLSVAPAGEDGRLLILNYFGAQRFGSARHGRGFAARHLIRGEHEEALRLLIATPTRKDHRKIKEVTRTIAKGWGDWKTLSRGLPRCPQRAAIEALAAGRGWVQAFAALPFLTQAMTVEAYQSHLWNGIARRLARTFSPDSSTLLSAADDFGEMLFPAAATVGPAWRELQLPLLSPRTELRDPWAGAAREVLAEEQIELAQLRIEGPRRPAFGEALRPLFIEAMAFSASAPEPDELGSRARLKRTLRFELPRGAYATVVLRALGQ